MADPRGLIQLTRSGAVFSGSQRDVERLRARFEQHHCIRLPGLLDPGLLQIIKRRIEQARFDELGHVGGLEICMVHDNTAGLLHFLTNNLNLFRMIREITGCGRIGCFGGRVYRILPGTNHYSCWHSDAKDHILIGLSINVSAEVYSGGSFQLRRCGAEQILCQMPNTGSGDSILFRIDKSLEHRMTDVEGTVPKTAFAGWFQSRPESRFLLGRPNE